MSLDDVLDRHGIGARHILLFVVCFGLAIMDGVHIQTMGISGTLVSAALHIAPNRFGLILSASEFGFMLGALALSPLADRFGRKTLIIICGLAFAICSFATAWATGFTSLFLLRLGTGIGMGGAGPAIVSLTSESVSARHRARVSTLLWSAIPAGGILGGFSAAWILPAFGWQGLFQAAGAVSLIFTVLILVLVPESLRFLHHAGAAETRLANAARRLNISLPPLGLVPPLAESPGSSRSARTLFTAGRAPLTLLLWLAFLLGFMSLIGVLAWTPTLLAQTGMGVSQAAAVIGWNNIGGMIGVASAGTLMERTGGRKILVPVLLLSGCVIAATGWSAPALFPTAGFALLTGLLLGGGTAGFIAIAATIYPTEVRSTGIGWGLAAGRVGGAVGPALIGVLVAIPLAPEKIFLAAAGPAMLSGLIILIMSRRDNTAKDID